MKYVILGIIQGLTEFLPVSSSGHLVLAQRILGIDTQQLMVILTCHLGTLFSLILFFFKDIIRVFKNLKLLGYILLVTLITGFIGIMGKNFFESLFTSVKAVSISLFITGLILIITKRFLEGKRDIDSLNLKDASILGLMQAVAIIPGISRSGMTISCLLFRKIDRQTAFRFSFLAGIPAISGAFLLQLKDFTLSSSLQFQQLLLSFIFSFLSGLLALGILRAIINKAKLHYFGYYCLLVAILSFLFIK
jgi:undecaprenyl-diphosphatase